MWFNSIKNIIFLNILITINLYASIYTKTTDDKNVYYSSEHFRTIMGVSNSDSSSMRDISYQLLNAAELSWQKEIVDLGFKQPRNSDTKKIDIYVANESAYNYETKKPENMSKEYAGWATSYPSDNTPYFVVNNKENLFNYLLDKNMSYETLMQVTISHEFFHTIQYAYFDETSISDDKWIRNIWWLEATAVLMEDEVYDDINDYLGFLEPFINDSYKNIECYSSFDDYYNNYTGREYSMVIFAKYIKEKYGMQIIKDSLLAIQTSGDDGYFEILDQLLRSDYDTTMQNSLLEFAKWLAYKDEYFEEGSSYPIVKRYTFSDKKSIAKGGVLLIDTTEAGWSMVALPTMKSDDLKIDNLTSIWGYKDNQWSNNIYYSSYNQIENTNINDGYWINLDSKSTLYYVGDDTSQTLDISNLTSGWHLKSGDKTITTTQLENAQTVWKYESGVWKVYSSDASISSILEAHGYESFTIIDPFVGYWVLK